MKNHAATEGETFLQQLMQLFEELSRGKYTRARELFELTRENEYPPVISSLAESFGMMLVQVEAREYHLKNLIEELQQAKKELEKARNRLSRENSGLKRALKEQSTLENVIGRSQSMQTLRDQVERLADSDVSVLLRGETGTGKEVIAKALHYSSMRAEAPFVALNCSAIPESLLESELFGIEQGVASGVSRRIGLVEQANGGTLFLDEIGDMPAASQVRLLRVLEERKVIRVGGRKAIPLHFRLLSATHKNLDEEIRQGRFRQDLLYRIKVVNLHIPPLRERGDDVVLLVEHFLRQQQQRSGRHALRFDPECMELFQRYSWPGNVRELENEVARCVALALEDRMSAELVSAHIATSEEVSSAFVPTGKHMNLMGMERMLIEQTLKQTEGNRTRAAELLGISREGLRKKIKRLGIDVLS